MTHINLTPCLWFSDEAEEAAEAYTAIFPNSRIVRVTRYGREGHDLHARPEGSVMTVDFQLDGHPLTALNGGPHFTFNEAISLQVFCDTQEEIDRYWDALSEDGDPLARQCGWLKDRFGVSWQVIPKGLGTLISDPESPACQRAMHALLRMEKIDFAVIRAAHAGSASTTTAAVQPPRLSRSALRP